MDVVMDAVREVAIAIAVADGSFLV